MKRILISFLVLAIAFMIAAPATAMGKAPVKGETARASTTISPILTNAQTDKLRVGIAWIPLLGLCENPSRMLESTNPGFIKGFEVDFGRAIAAAIGAPDIEWIPVDPTQRFNYLDLPIANPDHVDVSILLGTYTSDRDINRLDDNGNPTGKGYEFGTTYLYDGTNVYMDPNRGPDINGKYNIIVGAETSNLPDLQNLKATPNWPPNWEIEIATDFDAALGGFLDGTYNGKTIHGWASDKLVLIALKELIAPGAPWIMYFPGVIGKAALSPIVKEGDLNWLEVVRWTINVLIEAEEKGYTKANIYGEAPYDWGPTVPGLDPDWARKVIAAVGNYGEIWDSNLGKHGNTFMVTTSNPDLPPLNASPHAKRLWRPQLATISRGRNELWTNGGLLFSPSF
jgi:general L-amino acid transport system substrate-binding protein